MPLNAPQSTLIPTWGCRVIDMTPHPLDLAALVQGPKAAARAALVAGLDPAQVALLDAYDAAKAYELPENHVPLSTFAFQYEQHRSNADYAAIKTPNEQTALQYSGRAELTGDLVRSIVELVPYHAAASQLIAHVVSGNATPTEIAQQKDGNINDVDEIRRRMAGASADFQFGTVPFTVTAPVEEGGQ